MSSIENHIKFLLYLKDRLIVPGLGYFHSQYYNSTFDSEKNIISPTKKTILFDYSRTKDPENYLVNYISEKENIAKDIVRMQINEYILNINSILNSKEKYIFDTIGFFFIDESNKINFKSEEDINLNLNFFGLKYKPIKNVNLNITNNKKNISSTEHTHSSNENNYKDDDSYKKIEYFNIQEDYLNDKNLTTMNNFWLKLFTFIYIIMSISYFIIKKNTNSVLNKSEILNFSYFDNDNHPQIIETYHIIIASFLNSDIKKVKVFIANFESKSKNNKLELLLDQKSNRYRVSYKKSTNRVEIDKTLKVVREIIPDAWVYIIKEN